MVRIRPFRAEELDRVVAAFETADERTMPKAPSRDRLARRVEASGRFEDGMLDLAIDVDGRLVGDVQGRHVERTTPPGVYSLGIYVYDEADRGRGIGREAVRLMTELLFEEHGAERVELSTDVDNAAMRRTAEGLGFAFEGVLRSFMPSRTGRRDYALYAMTKEDWRETKDGDERRTFRS